MNDRAETLSKYQTDRPVRIDRIDAWACRYPIDRPVRTSFGTMRDRPGVFVRLEDHDGAFGWGEIFANWPAAGAEHRVNLLMLDIAELVLDHAFTKPSDLFHHLDKATSIRALQSAEWGPFHQVIAGLDMAAWDLFARRDGKSLRRYLNPTARDQVPAYASGIHIDDADRLLPLARKIGFRHFKVKIGFGLEADVTGLLAQAASLRVDETLNADANQAWDLGAAMEFLDAAGDIALGWLEEPIRADAPITEWQALADRSAIPLAGGENILGLDGFSRAISAKIFSVIQPDIAKWGGVTGCYEVARQAINAGKRYCPHFLGGGIGLAASAELLAAVGGDGLLEVDVNENQLRDAFRPLPDTIVDGCWCFDDHLGLGVEGLPNVVMEHSTLHRTSTKKC